LLEAPTYRRTCRELEPKLKPNPRRIVLHPSRTLATTAEFPNSHAAHRRRTCRSPNNLPHPSPSHPSHTKSALAAIPCAPSRRFARPGAPAAPKLGPVGGRARSLNGPTLPNRVLPPHPCPSPWPPNLLLAGQRTWPKAPYLHPRGSSAIIESSASASQPPSGGIADEFVRLPLPPNCKNPVWEDAPSAGRPANPNANCPRLSRAPPPNSHHSTAMALPINRNSTTRPSFRLRPNIVPPRLESASMNRLE